MQSVRRFEPKDYWACAAWWMATPDWQPVAPGILSNYGVVCSMDGQDAAAAWLYVLTPKWAGIEWIVANPAVPLKQRASAVKCVIERLRDDASRFGCTAITSSLKSNGLIRLYKKMGFIADPGMTNMTLRIK